MTQIFCHKNDEKTNRGGTMPHGNEAATTRYKQAVDWLKMVHSRKLALSLPMVTEAAAPIGTAPHFTPGQPHKFSLNRTKI